MSDHPDIPTLTVNNKIYAGWTEIRATRGIARAAADFDIAVTEGWAGPGSKTPWQIAPFDKAILRIDDDLVLTGYVDAYLPSFDATSHGVRISGRSKTEDLIDCMPEITGGEFNGYTADALSRAVCQRFGIEVKVSTDVGQPFIDATLQPGETAFAFIERLCRLRGVLATDDETGALVLTNIGSAKASGALIEGENIVSASGNLTAHERFSKYTVLSQLSLSFNVEDVIVDVLATAEDKGCPRYRPFASIAESALDQNGAQLRANWQAAFHGARSVSATITVKGWRQPDGTLWRINQLVPVKSRFLQLDRVLLVAGVSFILDGQGRRTELTLGPPEAFTPDPGEVHLSQNLLNNAQWNSVQAIAGGAAGL